MNTETLASAGIGLPLILLQSAGELTSLTDFAGKLTLTLALLVGLYYINKQKEKAELKREEALLKLFNESKASYEARIIDKDAIIKKNEEQIKRSQERNEELQTELIRILKKVNIPGDE